MASKPKGKYRKYGYSEGYDASFDTDWQPGEMREKYDSDELGEVAGAILEHWQQMAGTIYYDNVGDRALDHFEEGFHAGFQAGVEKQIAKLPAPLEILDDDLRLDHIPDVKECRELLHKFKAEGYSPNIYHVNDHGNVDLLSIGYNGAKIVQSWV